MLIPGYLHATVERTKEPTVTYPEVIIPDPTQPSPPLAQVTPPPPEQTPTVTICHFASDDYVISDSDGFGMCKERGGRAMAGGEGQRNLKNIKDAGKM